MNHAERFQLHLDKVKVINPDDDERLARAVVGLSEAIRTVRTGPQDGVDQYLDDAVRQATIILDRGKSKPNET